MRRTDNPVRHIEFDGQGCPSYNWRVALSSAWSRGIIRASRSIVAQRIRGSTTSNLRIGIGEDSHRTAPGGPLRLGGIDVPHDRHLSGHSDADVLLHAVTDALLGAAALPDIGRMFPNTDPANRGRDSAEMLAIAAQKVTEQNYRLVNLDCVVHAERPKLADYEDAMRHRIAGILGASPFQIGLKAKTGEGVGPVGREEIIEARCVALLVEITI